MPYCVDCGKKTQEGQRCSYCGVANGLDDKQNEKVGGSVVTLRYADVPWYRRRIYVYILAAFITVIPFIIIITGSVYRDDNGKAVPISHVAQTLICALAVFGIYYGFRHWN